MKSKKRASVRVKIGIRQAIEIEMTLRNARNFCGMNNASDEIMGRLASCIENVCEAISNRNRVAGLEK